MTDSIIKKDSLRSKIHGVFVQTGKPLTGVELMNCLAELNSTPNKTSVYRELDVLENKGFIKEIYLNGKSQYYELADLEEHHHIVCKKCGFIEDFIPTEKLELEIEKNMKLNENRTGFHIFSHTMEFFGFCNTCQLTVV